MVRQQWTRPEWHTTIDSTNLELLKNPTSGRVVVAEHQSAGMGRRGRTWTAPAGTSLAVSVAVTPPDRDLLGWVPLVAGMAVQRALADTDPSLRVALKWPNDVLISPGPQVREGKVCGVLASIAAESLVIGAGLNIDQTSDELPVATATSWALASRQRPLPPGLRRRWLTAYLEHLSVLLHDLARDPHHVRSAYTSVCATMGRQVSIEVPGGEYARGVASAVDVDGALMLTADGRTSTYHAGDVVHLR